MTAVPASRPIVVMDREELLEAVRKVVREEVAAGNQPPRFLDAAAVGDMLGCSPKMVHKLVKDEGLPVAGRLIRELRFDADDVRAWMRARLAAGDNVVALRSVR